MTARTSFPSVTTVDIDSLLAQDEVQALLEACEHAGTIRAQELADIVEAHELSLVEQEALLRALDKRGIDVVELPHLEPPPVHAAAEATTGM